MKFIYYILIVLLFNFCSNHHSEQDKIYWTKDTQLTWNDFKEKPDTNTNYFAGTEWRIKVEHHVIQDSVKFIISTYFDKNLSWVKERRQADNVLQHEKGHFDIAEIFARKLRGTFAHYRFNNSTIDKDINLCFNNTLNECAQAQHQYDFETQHSCNLILQKFWQWRIYQCLVESNDYSCQEFAVQLHN